MPPPPEREPRSKPSAASPALDSAQVEAAYLAELGHRLRRLRKSRGASRRQLARDSGVSERFLADIESGRGNPSIVRLEHVAAALGVRASSLLDGLPAIDQRAKKSVIALLGVRGAGKSTIGKQLAAGLGVAFVELDEDVERRMGLSLTEIFEVHGEATYRRIEREVMRERLDRSEVVVLATGGGIVTDPETWELLRARAHTVWLKAEPSDHWDRVVAQGDTRPMEGDEQAYANLQAILDSRVELYSSAEFVMQTSGKSIDDIVRELEARYS